jgi:D-serine deaminase-like pyridoxal phosphate-dependent protein
MQAQADRLGVRLRPHVKTHKSVPVARLQQGAGALGITVSTLKEAEQFFAAGFDDILYAVCIAPAKLPLVRRLRERGCRVTVVVDSLAAAHAVVAEPGHARDVMIEIDTDGHRAGVRPDAALLLEIGHHLHAGGAQLRGVMTHAGESYNLHTPEALAAMAEQERARCVQAAERLRAAGLPCPEVSVGSTPTALSAAHLSGVTELRAGVYAFQDLVMANVGVCLPGDIALSVLATVIGHQADKGWLLTDAGWMALSRDRGTQSQALDYGYGAVCDEDGRLIEGLLMNSANQEHGILSWRDGRIDDLSARWPIGTRLRILPNHACATAAQFAQYHALQPDGSVQIWERFNGW